MAKSFIQGNIGFAEFSTGAAVINFKGSAGTEESTVTTVKIDTKDKTGKIASWGKNNDTPQKIIAQVRKNASATSALAFRCDAHYGNGLTFLRKDVTDDGKHNVSVVPIDAPEMAKVKEFFTKSKMNMFWKETITDLEWWRIAFPEFILSNDFTQINRVKRHRAAWCRYEIMNEVTGLVENIYISEKFGKETVNTDSIFAASVPVIDSYWTADEVKEYCKAKNIHKFIRPVFFPLLDEPYYPEGGWHAVVNSGWLEVANSVPAWVNNMFKNQVSIMYQIEIDERYYETVFKSEWMGFTKERRDQERKNTIDAINDHLSKPENAGKSIQTMMYLNEQSGQQQSYVKIQVIDNKYKDGVYLPQAEAANSEILFGTRVDPSLIGAGIPGGKLGAGSGSDKTAAFNIINALMKTPREITLDSYEFIRDYNGWDPTIMASFENILLTTLDKNPTGSEKVAS